MNNPGRIARRFYLSPRLPALLLTFSLAMLLTACGGSSDETGSDPTTPSIGAGPDQSDIKGPVSLSWTAPEQRENGDELDITELGGYELRYRPADGGPFETVIIDDPWTMEYYIEWLEGTYEFQIAAFDDSGLYSEFITLHPDS